MKNTSERKNTVTLSPLRAALLNWYPFPGGARALLLGRNTEPLLPLLKRFYTRTDTEICPGAQYDCIAAADLIEETGDVPSLLEDLNSLLSDDGILLLSWRNRFGLKYLCGGTDEYQSAPFLGLEPAGNAPRLYARREMETLLSAAGFAVSRCYYLMPDSAFVQAVYTDEFLPDDSIRDRVMPFDLFDSPLVAWERDLYDDMVREGTLPHAANVYLAECRKPGAADMDKHVIYAALSTDRGEEHGFATVLYSDGTALKAALFPEGRSSLETLFSNVETLRSRGILTVPQKLSDKGIEMPLIREEHLMHYLRRQLTADPDAFLAVFSRIEEDVLRSAPPAEDLPEDLPKIWGADLDTLGPILQTAWIDMIPYNAFWADGEIRYFDQEFTVEYCPAKYVLFRALNYTWIHIPEAEKRFPLETVKGRFGLTALWAGFARRENRFVAENRNWNKLKVIYDHNDPDRAGIAARREALASSAPSGQGSGANKAAAVRKKYHVGLLMGVFDLFHIGHLKLITRAKEQCSYLRVGVLSDALVMEYKGFLPTIPLAERMAILAAVRDVDEVVEIDTNPSRLEEWKKRPFDCFFSGDDYAGHPYWEWERKELQKLGADICFFPYTKEQSSTMIRAGIRSRKGQRVGYLSGTFDLFHVGHLNLLRRAKEQCDILIVGVHESGAWKGTETFIPFNERKSIIAGCRYVDRVVDCCEEDSDAWELYHFDLLFVGSDYYGTPRFQRYEDFFADKDVKIVYLPYTVGTSSTMIRNRILQNAAGSPAETGVSEAQE